MKTPTEKLDQIANQQFLWKNITMRRLAILIVKKAIDVPLFWPDEIGLEWLEKSDSKCVGQTYRLLMKARIIVRTGQHRRSKSKSRSGGEVWQYRCESLTLARTFLRKQGELENFTQTQMQLLSPSVNFPD